jgi:carbon storage regulator
VLVLTRKKDEKIIIDDRIEITIVEIDNGRVKLGIQAPENVEIVREELYSQIKAENINAIKKSFIDLKELKNIQKKMGNKGDET